jgi:hypothetical protein
MKSKKPAASFDPSLELAKIRIERMRYLEKYGEKLAKKKGYRYLSGLNAVHFYLVEKYHWTPMQVRNLSDDDLLFLMTEEDYVPSSPA